MEVCNPRLEGYRAIFLSRMEMLESIVKITITDNTLFEKKMLDFTCFVQIIQNFWLLDNTEWFNIVSTCINFSRFF